MTADLITDISTITTLPEKTLRKLADKSLECICHSVLETQQVGENLISIDVGIGNINILVSNDEVTYGFEPSKKLENMLVNTINNKKSPLVASIEDGLVGRIINAYKDLF